MRIRYSALARADLRDHWDYIQQENRPAADRLLQSVAKAVRGLAKFPGKGAALELSSPAAQGLRRWSAAGFPNHLIIYRIEGDVLEVVRVLHGARDLERELGGG